VNSYSKLFHLVLFVRCHAHACQVLEPPLPPNCSDVLGGRQLYHPHSSYITAHRLVLSILSTVKYGVRKVLENLYRACNTFVPHPAGLIGPNASNVRQTRHLTMKGIIDGRRPAGNLLNCVRH